MKVIVYPRYGPPEVLQLSEVERPVPQDDEVLVKVRAAALNRSDWILLRGKPFLVRLMTGGPRRPKRGLLGSDLAGVVEGVGTKVHRFRPEDEAFGNLSVRRAGSCAEYACARQDRLALKPSDLSFEATAAAPQAGITALQALRDSGHLRPGQKVMVHGASGGVGTFAVQLAKLLGAEVTAVTGTHHLEAMRSRGGGGPRHRLHQRGLLEGRAKVRPHPRG